MAMLEQVQQLIPTMSPGEKAQALQWLARDIGNAFPWIESAPEVCGDNPRIVYTLIPVWLLVEARRVGSSESDILRAYPTLRAEGLANSWLYYLAHKVEIEQQIAKNETA